MKIINRIGQGVLMVDDEENFLLTAGVLLKSAGIEQVWTISDSRQVMRSEEHTSELQSH